MTGALFVACGVGLRRVLYPGRGGTWGPSLIGALGAGLITAGVFVTDAGAGFPAGAPEGTPEMSWHGVLHEVGYVVVMLSWTAACFVLRSRFATSGRRGWTRASLVAVAAVVVISAWPHPDSFYGDLNESGALLPGPGVTLAGPTFEEWLSPET